MASPPLSVGSGLSVRVEGIEANLATHVASCRARSDRTSRVRPEFKCPTTCGILCAQVEGKRGEQESQHRATHNVAPNGSRLSCGRSIRRRKAVEWQKKRLAGEATRFLPHGRPAASSAC